MLLHNDEQSLIFVDQNDTTKVYNFDLNAGKIVDQFRLNKGQSVIQLATEFKNAQTTAS
jgi:hypothetical protein